MYKLIVAANRDEFYARKTEPAHRWKDHPQILGGRDLEAGGTWLGVNINGRISMLTNYRDLKTLIPQAPSRGFLVSDFLAGDEAPESYLYRISLDGRRYNGFNLVAGTVDDLWYYANFGKGVQRVSPGIHGLSNHLLDTPWPKVEKGKALFTQAVGGTTVSHDELFNLLYNTDVYADESLPSTGLPLERERALSAMFIRTPDYGSRCSTVIFVDHQNHVQFWERVFDVGSDTFSTSFFEFQIQYLPVPRE